MVVAQTEALTKKHRPQEFADVVGQAPAVTSLVNALKKGLARTFLFTGPSGCGKTTLARLAAKQLGCDPGDLLEVDAASHTGIDDMRLVASQLQYRPLGESAVKVVIVDEFHALSKAAVQSLLKVIEEPPPWAYWMLCTTEPTKVLETVRTRSVQVNLKPVSISDLEGLLEEIVHHEKLDTVEGVVELCAEAANGSPRQAISNLVAAAGAKDLREAEKLMATAQESTEAVELARFLFNPGGGGWSKAQDLLGKLKKAEVNPETVRHIVRGYMTSVALSSKKKDDVEWAVAVLDEFATPFNSFDGMSPLVLAVGRLVLR